MTSSLIAGVLCGAAVGIITVTISKALDLNKAQEASLALGLMLVCTLVYGLVK